MDVTGEAIDSLVHGHHHSQMADRCVWKRLCLRQTKMHDEWCEGLLLILLLWTFRI